MLRSVTVYPLILLSFLIGTWPVLEKIVRRWFDFDEAYSHGLMIFGLSLYMLFRTLRDRFLPLSPAPVWLAPLILVIAAYLVAAILYVEAVQQILLVPMLLLAIAAVSGFSAMWRLLLPVGLLFFAIPFWDYAAWPLQLITTSINELLLGLWGIDFEVEGVLVFLPGIGAFEIAHGCSGLRYLLVAMSLATVYSELNYNLWRNRIVLFAAAVGLAMLANWVRVFVIIYMGYKTEMESSLIRDHEMFGWVLFAISLIPLFILAGRLERSDAESHQQPQKTEGDGTHSSLTSRTVLVGCLIALFLSPLAVYGTRGGGAVSESFSLNPTTPEGWSSILQPMDGVWESDYSGEDHEFRRIWFKVEEGETNQLPDIYSTVEVLTYERQYPGKELIRDRNKIVDTGKWRPSGNIAVDIAGQELSAVRLADRATEDPAYVIYGFYVSGKWAADPVRAKLLQLYSALNTRQDASLVAVSVRCSECDPEAHAQAWAEEVIPQIQAALDKQFATED